MNVFLLVLAIVASIALMAVSYWPQAHIAPTEAFGFVTGAWCVWLTVRQHIWNWPIGIASSVFYVILFLQNTLFGDMGLQVVYIVLGIVGWYWWLHGGQNQGKLAVSTTSRTTAAMLALFVLVCTAGLTVYFRRVHDSAPFLDALTTALSLAAQYQITKKLFENWYVWIVADTIYIGLYVYKHLFLTAGLYSLFIVMCLFGLRYWRLSLSQTHVAGLEEPLEVPHG